MHNDNTQNEDISLNKFISSTGFCSRREADKYIQQGRVTVNNKLARLGMRVREHDSVAIDGQPLKGKKKKKQQTIYIALNKPVGVTSTTDTKDRTNIISFLNYPKRVFPVGRLDKDSDGLILLTNDGDIVNKILRAGNFHEKEYIVTVDKTITDEFIQQMSKGVRILGQMTRECFVRKEGNKRFRIILTQGMNRQIRRMCQQLDYKVVSLSRVRIMNIHLGNLPVGNYRLLTQPEIDEMNRMIASSSKTEEASAAPVKPMKTNKPEKKKSIATAKEDIAKKTTARNKSYKDWRKKK